VAPVASARFGLLTRYISTLVPGLHVQVDLRVVVDGGLERVEADLVG